MLALARSSQTSGLYPPRVEAIVVVLSGDLSVPEFQPQRQMRSHLRISGEGVHWHSEVAAPVNFHRDVIAVDDRVEDVELLGPQRLLSLLRVGQDPVQFAMGSDRLKSIGELFLDDVLGEELRQGASFRVVLDIL